ncbi:hypothetical protein O3G_MSEX005293 [Manduca sexta]|uniref:Uncharacterized protein n=2 Tax=Manduca sexta TaxID=7130 RepID=A0A922CJN1_MANSE|nr:hypothetical protein O3G_MSEX005293 [Manduca sexta]
MMKLGGFKASLNIFNSKRHSKEHAEFEPGLCITGAYRTNRDEYFGNDRVYEPPKKLTPSMVKLPRSHETSEIRPTKSTSDLTKTNNLPTHLRHSTPTVSLDPRGEEQRAPVNSTNGVTTVVPNAKNKKEQEKLRKKQLAEQKAREKAAAKERAKQEKLAKARAKQEAKENAKREKQQKKSKSPVAQPPQQSTSAITPTSNIAQQRSANPLSQPANYPTNTLDSSISRSSGPPPYTEVPKTVPKQEPATKQNHGTGDVIFIEPIDTGSWDMVSQHRQQVSKSTKTTEVSNKQRVMDLNYNFNKEKNNTDA